MSRMPRFKDLAICIREIEWSETSQVVVLLTREHGKMRGLSNGSKRTSPSSIAKFSGGIELLNLGMICGTTKKTQSLATLTEWDLMSDHYHLRTDLKAQQAAMYAADLANALLAEDDPHPAAFEAMQQLLEVLASADEVTREAALLRFQWDLLRESGYQPQLNEDVQTHRPLPDAETYGFDPIAGGLTSSIQSPDWRVRRQTVELLRGLDGDATMDADAAAYGRANRLLCVYVRAILDKELPTMRLVLGE